MLACINFDDYESIRQFANISSSPTFPAVRYVLHNYAENRRIEINC